MPLARARVSRTGKQSDFATPTFPAVSAVQGARGVGGCGRDIIFIAMCLLQFAKAGSAATLPQQEKNTLHKRGLKILTALTLNRSANHHLERGLKKPHARRNRPSLNHDPAFCAALIAAGGVGELYQRRSTFVCNR
jgi:hypothetical protein